MLRLLGERKVLSVSPRVAAQVGDATVPFSIVLRMCRETLWLYNNVALLGIRGDTDLLVGMCGSPVGIVLQARRDAVLRGNWLVPRSQS